MNIYQRINEVRKAVDYLIKDKKVESYMAIKPATPLPWQARKDKILARINAEREVFINPRKHAKDWQAGLELVGKGLASYDGATFRAVA